MSLKFLSVAEGTALTFKSSGSDFVDDETGPTRNLLGMAGDGPFVAGFIP